MRKPRKKETRKRNRVYPTGANHPRWLGGERIKTCPQCGMQYGMKPKEPYTFFAQRKFCSQQCSVKGQKYNRGAEHPNYRETARRKNRGGSHHRWANAVLSRDQATCQRCGATNVELHAHHIKSFQHHPELRWEVSNGITLCYRCHWAEHTALNENAVNSVDTRPGHAEGNTEPSERGNLLEGVTTRGRAYRRWIGRCDWCKTAISKRLSDIKGKRALFCSRSCAMRWIRANCGPLHLRTKSPTAVIPSTSAARESEDIV